MHLMTTWRRRLSFCGLLALAAAAAPQAQDLTAETEAWRAEREARLAADDGWLTVAGLFFLTEGDNTFGASPLNDIVLRTGPDSAGVFTLRRGEITVRATAGETLTIDGRDTATARLWPYEGRVAPHDRDRAALALRPLQRRPAGHPHARPRQRDSPRLHRFALVPGRRGLPGAGAGTSPTPNRGRWSSRTSWGDVETFRTSGSVAFSVGGAEHRMTAFDAGGRLWFIFRDLTSGSETYPAARFLYADPPEDGWTTVDFNRAYNPPLRLQPLHHLPAAAPREPAAGPRRGGRDGLPHRRRVSLRSGGAGVEVDDAAGPGGFERPA